MYKLEMYKYNNQGKLIATFEQIFINQQELDLKKDKIQQIGFLNYKISKDNKVIKTNYKG